MHLLITLLSLLIVTSVARASMTLAPTPSRLKADRFHGMWRIDRQQSTIGAEGTTEELNSTSGVVAFAPKHLRIGRNVFEYQVLKWGEAMVEIQFWLESGQLADGVIFLNDGVLSFQFLAGEEYHYFVMHRERSQEVRPASSVAQGSHTYGWRALSP